MAVINMGPQDPETLMPIHLTMKLNKDGQGPLNDDERGRYGCWCVDGLDCEEVWEYWTTTYKKVEE